MGYRKDIDYTLYLVTDRELMQEGKTITEAVEEAILGGVTLVQLREKRVSTLEYYNIACEVKEVTDRYDVPLIIDDRLDIALAVDAAGLHVGQEDLPAKVAREILGPDKILGVSARNLDEALEAKNAGADYLGVGAMFETSTKDDPVYVSIDELKRITKEIDIAVVAIGGINENTIDRLKGTNIDGIAVVSAIIGKEDIRGAARDLLERFNSL
ncbi:MAG TPA: thiamine phosphate synthase [Clostridiales bacterium]|nr:thiamine phosphate synthase [Clostridiales bacterium]